MYFSSHFNCVYSFIKLWYTTKHKTHDFPLESLDYVLIYSYRCIYSVRHIITIHDEYTKSGFNVVAE